MASVRASAARSRSVKYLAGFYRHEPRPGAPAALVIGYATPPAHAYPGALDALCDTLS
jgi:GntR family transcriptional regulator/MocR family aminotransferase